MMFTIGGRLPSLNEYIEACRRHPQAGAKLKRNSQDAVIWNIRKARLKNMLKPITKPCRVSFEYYEHTAKRDIDNVTGFAHKVILDALVEEGILPNDTQKWVVGFVDDFMRCERNKDCISITIKEINQ